MTVSAQCHPAFVSTTLPTGITAVPALFFVWDDLQDFGSSEFAEYVTLGEAGGQTFHLCVRMRRIALFCSTTPVTAMISAHERSDLVKVSSPTVGDGQQSGAGRRHPGQSMSFHPPS